MLGFKKVEHAAVTISGIELVHKIKKGQFDTSSLALSKDRAPQIWEAVMDAYLFFNQRAAVKCYRLPAPFAFEERDGVA